MSMYAQPSDPHFVTVFATDPAREPVDATPGPTGMHAGRSARLCYNGPRKYSCCRPLSNTEAPIASGGTFGSRREHGSSSLLSQHSRSLKACADVILQSRHGCCMQMQVQRSVHMTSDTRWQQRRSSAQIPF